MLKNSSVNKKFTKIALSLIFLFLICIICASCECNHLWDSGTVKTEATDTSDGTVVYLCYRCGETRVEAYHTNHVYTNNWGNDENNHWLICDKEGCEVATVKGEHSFDEKGFCPVCKMQK